MCVIIAIAVISSLGVVVISLIICLIIAVSCACKYKSKSCSKYIPIIILTVSLEVQKEVPLSTTRNEAYQLHNIPTKNNVAYGEIGQARPGATNL